ncbi:transcription initiation protein [Mucilaginibacter rigui]|uniref:Transcription initiation protein n=1 Tax=Mucilaginibacter rigui TaxID=534635 RepID=A0ABR7X2T9_9SPHI|nr:YciI family protein [Mucilaginibacter rigui]MBD1384897.1 transcription initiation protein [Mucilaginibacter rigui]
MKDYILIFRADYSYMAGMSADERQAVTQRYMDWIGGIAGKGKLLDRGNRLAPTGKVVAAKNVVTNGPYTEVKEFIGGYSLIRAESYEEVVKLMDGSPVFELNGKIEIREITPM